jgi:hypothetical protein
MPVFTDHPGEARRMSHAWLGQPIIEVAELLKSDGSVFQMSMPQAEQRAIHRGTGMPAPLECYRQIARSSLAAVADAVRNVILEWSLRLEQQGILGEGMRFSPEEKAIAMTSQNIHIGSFQGILGDVTGSTVTQHQQMTITAGDFNSLQRTLTEAGVSPDDLQALKSALDADPKPKSKDKLGPKVNGWLGAMMSKAASGAWKVTLETAGKLLPPAIAAYYGLPS